MGRSVNKVILLGRAGKDPSVHILRTGTIGHSTHCCSWENPWEVGCDSGRERGANATLSLRQTAQRLACYVLSRLQRMMVLYRVSIFGCHHLRACGARA